MYSCQDQVIFVGGAIDGVEDCVKLLLALGDEDLLFWGTCSSVSHAVGGLDDDGEVKGSSTVCSFHRCRRWFWESKAVFGTDFVKLSLMEGA